MQMVFLFVDLLREKMMWIFFIRIAKQSSFAYIAVNIVLDMHMQRGENSEAKRERKWKVYALHNFEQQVVFFVFLLIVICSYVRSCLYVCMAFKMWCDVYYVYAENSDYTIQNLKCELLDFRCGNNLTLCASRMNVCVQCFFLTFCFSMATTAPQAQMAKHNKSQFIFGWWLEPFPFIVFTRITCSIM